MDFCNEKNHIAFGLYRRLDHTPLPSSSDIVLKAQQSRSDYLESSFSKHKGKKKKNIVKKKHSMFPIEVGHTSPVHGASIPLRPRSKLVASEKLRDKNEWLNLFLLSM